MIGIADDGRGVDIEKMKRQAVELGLMATDKLQKFSKTDAFDLLFTNTVGSTSPNSVAGERSGMLMVQQTVESLNGSIELDSRVGEGTKFTIKLPLTLAIIQALVFGVGKRTFAVPLSNIDQVTRIGPGEISMVGGREVFELRERVVNLIRPHKLLSIPDSPNGRNKKMYVIVVRSSDRRLVGVLADQLMEKEELVKGGHFISKGSSSRWSLDTRNIWPQCKGCNGFGMKDGTAQISYTIYMQEKFGVDFVEEMLASKKDVYKISTPDYRDLISDLQSKINVELARLGET